MGLSSKKIAAAVLVAAVLVFLGAGSALAAPPWSDAPDSWWVNTYDVTAAEVATVADGYPGGTFKPAQAVTRGQFAKMAVSGLGLTELNPAAPTFKDVPKTNTFYTHIEGAYAQGLIGGYPVIGGLEFRPANKISRQQTNSILARYLVNREVQATGVIHGPGGLTYQNIEGWYAAHGTFYLGGYSDYASIAADHRATTAYLIYHEVVKGANGKLNPLGTLNRAQAAVMILRVAEEAADMTTVPPAPTDLAVVPTSPGTDTTPIVTGVTIPGGIVHIYDAANGATTPVDLFQGVVDSQAPHAGPTGAFSVVLPTLSDGTHVLSARVKNAGGLVSQFSASVTYVLDTTAPTGATVKPTVPLGQVDAAVNTKEVEFTVTASDTLSGVDRVVFEYSVDQTTPAYQTISTDTVAGTGGVYQAVWPTSGTLAGGLNDGQYLLRATVYDEAGNTRLLDPVKITVDTKAPTAQIATGTLVAQGADGIFYTESGAPLFGGIGADTSGGAVGTLPSGVAKVEFLRAPAGPAPDAWDDFTVISADLGDSGFAQYATAIADGAYMFAVRCTDRAGNQSLLMNGNPPSYLAGVTRLVTIDNAAPVVTVTAPAAGALLPDATPFTITWTLTDVSAPTSVKIEYSATGAAPWTTITDAAPYTPGTTGSYLWTGVPAVTGADVTTYKIQVTAVDKAAVPVGDVAGHTTFATSGAFTLYDGPLAPATVTGSDPDATTTGVDWHDFHATWTPSTSAHIVQQWVYLLKDGQTVAPTDTPVATFVNNTSAAWDSTSGLVLDSRGAALAAGNYRITVVAADPAGRTASKESDTFTVVAE